MNTTSANLNSAAAINALTERANAAIDAAVDKVRDDLMKNNQNDYVIPVKNMGHNLKQVVRDNAAYGLAALITHRMLALVAERLRQFEGKVYNVRVERMMNDCLAAAIEQSVDADIKIRAYIDRSHYSWSKVVFHHILPGMYDAVNISFNFDVNELTQGQKRIVTGGTWRNSLKESSMIWFALIPSFKKLRIQTTAFAIPTTCAPILHKPLKWKNKWRA